MKVSELEGEQLNYWTARADGREAKIMQPGERLGRLTLTEAPCVALTEAYTDWWQPFHVYWGSAGPIIERERIELLSFRPGEWEAQMAPEDAHYIDQAPGDAMRGPTPLVAAMRAFIASKFGEEVPTP